MSEPKKTDWLEHARFGLFLHWGLYSVAGRHEWVRNRERIPGAEYDRYLDRFDPDLFDPDAWAGRAWAAGMRYMVITTKHHEGFCLWDSALTEYKATETPCGRDLLPPLLEAFRARGFRIGFYHSLLDWHHPDYPIDGLHPLRDDDQARAAAGRRDLARYREYLHGQVRELLTGYGRIDVLWMDFSYPQMDWDWCRGLGRDAWDSEALAAMARELQPQILINDRLDIPGDFRTPEQVQPETAGAGLWEACQTLNGSWGYDRDNRNMKPAGLLLRMLIDGVSKGGNMLLNVGPDGRGAWQPEAVDRLAEIGGWMGLHERAIRGCGPAPWTPPPDSRYTARGDRLYLHLFSWPFGAVRLPRLGGRVRYAQFLNDGSEIRVRDEPSPGGSSDRPGSDAVLQLPVAAPPAVVPVIEIFLDGPVA